MELTAKFVKLGNELTGTSAKGEWCKQEVIVETMDQYPKTVCLQLWSENDRNAAMTSQSGDTITVNIAPESREFNGKWYTDIRGWGFRNAAQRQAPQQHPSDKMFDDNGDFIEDNGGRIFSSRINDDVPF